MVLAKFSNSLYVSKFNVKKTTSNLKRDKAENREITIQYSLMVYLYHIGSDLLLLFSAATINGILPCSKKKLDFLPVTN